MQVVGKSILLAVAVSVLGASALGAESAETPFRTLPYTPSLDVSAMDRSVNPCEDLYTYACGHWSKNNPLPADQSSWSVYGKMGDDNRRYLWGVLSDLSTGATRTPSQQKIGDFFAACMDEAAIEKAGRSPIEPYLNQVQQLTSKAQLGALLGEFHQTIGGGDMFFGSGIEPDARDASKVIVGLYAGGLGLPDRDYYTKTDAKSKATRERYLQYIEQLFGLLGESAQQAHSDAQIVLSTETRLARSSLTAVERRDPYKVYHRFTLGELQKLAPNLTWTEYYSHFQAQPGEWLDVSEPKFVTELNTLLGTESLANLQTYLRWKIANSAASMLPKAWELASFDFHSKYLRGVPTQRPRWKKCVAYVDRDLGDALGKEFVERTFPAAVKAQTVRVTEQVERAMKQRIEGLDWMSAETKKQALTKLSEIRNKVGYPALWRDYQTLEITPHDFFGNVMRASKFEAQRQSAKLGQPMDRTEWLMSAPTVDAYYYPQVNDINFPAGVLLPPLFDPKLDDAPSYGNTGSTIGHELTHAFDDEGRQFDGKGNLRDWWTKQDATEFENRAQCVRDQYAHYTVVDDIKINSKLTSGEDIADLGGTILAWMAWQEQTRAMQLESKDGLTPGQRFFVGMAQWSCADVRPEQLRLNAVVNPHSPPKYRINGVVVNMPEFAKAFQCKAGDALVKKPAEVCKVW
jgi:putative endopeptidase